MDRAVRIPRQRRVFFREIIKEFTGFLKCATGKGSGKLVAYYSSYFAGLLNAHHRAEMFHN
jgi:hypothetical protein